MDKFYYAWENAIPLEDLNSGQYRMCYLCKGIMNHGNKWNSDSNPKNAWNVDHLDGNKSNGVSSNWVAVHYNCNIEKKNQDFTQKYKSMKGQNWTS